MSLYCSVHTNYFYGTVQQSLSQVPEELYQSCKTTNNELISKTRESDSITYSCCMYENKRYSRKRYSSAAVSSSNSSCPDQGDSELVSKKIENEVKYLRNLQHSNILHFVEIQYGSIPLLVTEEIRCSLFDYLETAIYLEEKEKIHIAYEVICGLSYLHENSRIAHLNLTTKSIVITAARKVVKISNFEYARSFDILETVLSPENDLLRELRDEACVFDFLPKNYLHCCGGSADIFSFGCILLNLYSLQWPKPAHDLNEDMKK